MRSVPSGCGWPTILHAAGLQLAGHTLQPKGVASTGTVRPATEGSTVEKQGDKVVRIIVTCTCGEKVEVECLYPAGS